MMDISIANAKKNYGFKNVLAFTIPNLQSPICITRHHEKSR